MPVTTLLIAVVVSMLVGLVLGRWATPGDPGDTRGADRGRLSYAQGGPADSAPGGIRLGRCSSVHAAQVRALHVLRPAIAQWEAHAGAMNKLALGVISPTRALRFWEQTRERTLGYLTAFAEARNALHEMAMPCPVPNSRTSDRARACASAVASRHRDLERAEVVLDGWRLHVRQMESLRRGESSVEDVVETWQQGWRESRRQVPSIRAVLRTVPDGGDGACAD